MKRIMTFLLALVLIVSLFAGCAPKEAEQPAAETAKTETKTENTDGSSETEAMEIDAAKISFVFWGQAQEEMLKNMIAGFNEVYPQVEVELQILPWGEYWTKLEASATSGDMPDVFVNHPSFSQIYADAGMLMPLDEAELQKYDPNFSYGNYFEHIPNHYVFDGVNYGVPKDIDCILMIYNKEIFDNAGIDYPTNDTTWDEVVDLAQQVTDKDNDIYGFAAYNHIQKAWGSMLYQNGAYILSEDKKSSGLDIPAAAENLQMYLDMMYKYEVSPTLAQFTETGEAAMFKNGKIAMMYTGNWLLDGFVKDENISSKFGITTLPAINGDSSTMSNGLGYSIAANTDNEAAAKAFVAYMGSEAGQIIGATGSTVPAFKTAVPSWVEAHKDEYDTTVVQAGLEDGVPYYATLNRTKWEEKLKEYVDKIFLQEMTAEEGLKEAAAAMNEILANE